MNIQEAYELLDGTDETIPLTKLALSQLVGAAAELTGRVAELASFVASLDVLGTALLQDLGLSFVQLGVYMPELLPLLHGQEARWVGSEPASVREAKILFGAARQCIPPLIIEALWINDQPVNPGAQVRVGSRISVKGRGLGTHPDRAFIRMQLHGDPRSAWDFHLEAPLNGWLARAVEPLPVLELGKPIDVFFCIGWSGLGTSQARGKVRLSVQECYPVLTNLTIGV